MKMLEDGDWDKVKQALRNIKGTLYLNLRLTIDDLACSNCVIDRSHGVHWDCKDHTHEGVTL